MRDIIEGIDRRLKEIDEYMQATDEERGRHITAADELMSAMRAATEDRARLLKARAALTADDTRVVMPGDTRAVDVDDVMEAVKAPYVPSI